MDSDDRTVREVEEPRPQPRSAEPPDNPEIEADRDRIDPDVKAGVAYLLRKNAELYRRLAR